MISDSEFESFYRESGKPPDATPEALCAALQDFMRSFREYDNALNEKHRRREMPQIVNPQVFDTRQIANPAKTLSNIPSVGFLEFVGITKPNMGSQGCGIQKSDLLPESML